MMTVIFKSAWAGVGEGTDTEGGFLHEAVVASMPRPVGFVGLEILHV